MFLSQLYWQTKIYIIMNWDKRVASFSIRVIYAAKEHQATTLVLPLMNEWENDWMNYGLLARLAESLSCRVGSLDGSVQTLLRSRCPGPDEARACRVTFHSDSWVTLLSFRSGFGHYSIIHSILQSRHSINWDTKFAKLYYLDVELI